MEGTTDEATLAPLDELLDALPEILKAKERERLGGALQKATNSAERYNSLPDEFENLIALLDAITFDKAKLLTNVANALNAVRRTARILAGQPSFDDLTNINQHAMPQLPLHVDNIKRQIEDLWRASIEQALGGQAALGQVLEAIAGVESLGRDVTRLASQVGSLTDVTRQARDRVSERDVLVKKASAMDADLLSAGIAPPIADFLVAVAANPVQLSKLSEEILTWLREHDALALFAVSIRPA